MRPHDPRISLTQALEAGDRIGKFLAGTTLEQYSDDVLVSAAVERQFEILGEALARALASNPSLRERIPEVGAVVAFRNRLAHAYDDISDRVVWKIAHDELPSLLACVRAVLEELS
jgi:uncharacterized protein with HEPN domain